MNYCRRCESDYEKPGTCNCFAGKRSSALQAHAYFCPHCGLSFYGAHLCYASPVTNTSSSTPRVVSSSFTVGPIGLLE